MLVILMNLKEQRLYVLLFKAGLRSLQRPGREADHSPPASVEVKKMWIYTPTPPTPSWRSA
jgi:hypothetical protein